MADIDLNSYKNFEKQWKFVTVRYRQDTQEMRFTYANPVAWEALLKNPKEFPDGSVFAKIGLATGQDPAFPSSVAPQGQRRIQIMVRNKKKYHKTDGWGYALFEPDGTRFKGDADARSYACAACHKVVAHQGAVFSKPMGSQFENIDVSENFKKVIRWSQISLSEAPDPVRKHIQSQHKNILQLKGDLEEAIFSGTLDEMRPTLLKTAKEKKMPAFLISKDKKNFIVVQQDASIACENNEVGLLSIHTVENKQNPLITLKVCEKNK
jgi:hypothetical protein